MAMMAGTCAQRAVWGGVDTHRDQHVAAVIDEVGRVLGTRAFAATGRGYTELVVWMREHGSVRAIGVEGTGVYGVGLARYLQRVGVLARDIDRPDRKRRRLQGKSDPIDAIAAAVACLRGERIVEPKQRDGRVEALRNLRVARRSAVDQRAQCQRQIRAVIVTAPDHVREQLRGLDLSVLIDRCACMRPDRARVGEVEHATRITLRALARRHRALSLEVAELDGLIEPLVAAINPRLLEQVGVGPDVAGQLLVTIGENANRIRTEAAFAMACGVAPIPASSGRTQRHRLNRGGDRQANRALHTIVLCRMRYDPRTQAYVARRTTEGLSKPEIMRCLKRYIARDLYRLLTT